MDRKARRRKTLLRFGMREEGPDPIKQSKKICGEAAAATRGKMPG